MDSFQVCVLCMISEVIPLSFVDSFVCFHWHTSFVLSPGCGSCTIASRAPFSRARRRLGRRSASSTAFTTRVSPVSSLVRL